MRHSDKREFLMLAHKYTECKNKVSIGGWFMSEKLDGQLVVWDGGVTRGMFCKDVRFANTVKDKTPRIATGLWTRGGKPVSAPDWFLDRLPPRFLAGELYAGRGNFQVTESAVRKFTPIDSEWKQIQLHCFDTPSLENFCQPGRIHIRSWRVTWGTELLSWVKDRVRKMGGLLDAYKDFEDFVNRGSELENAIIKVVPQKMLSFSTAKATEQVEAEFGKIVSEGGEGVILRHPSSSWTPFRSYDYLKMKEEDDDEGVVVGYRTGKITDDGSRNLGRMGSLIVQWNGLEFDISGFADNERELSDREWAANNPDKVCPTWVVNPSFPIGSLVTFKYSGLTDAGIPRHANYLRRRDNDE